MIPAQSNGIVSNLYNNILKQFDSSKEVWYGKEEVTYTIAGVNHCVWLTHFSHQGTDLYPQLDQPNGAGAARLPPPGPRQPPVEPDGGRSLPVSLENASALLETLLEQPWNEGARQHYRQPS
jgi:hypothetical protein